MSSIHTPLIIVAGQTASGKSNLAIALAQKFKGEIISADSRQVYKNLDIGTGKITKKEQKLVPHHLLDVVSFRTDFTLSHFLHHTKKIQKEIISRSHIPIICGGTFFWIDSLVYDQKIPTVVPNKKLRTFLETYSNAHLVAFLKLLDPERYVSIDKNNKRRVIRALEINILSGQHVPFNEDTPLPSNVLYLAIAIDREKLALRIHKRLHSRMSQGMITEAKKLHMHGMSYTRMTALGLEYRHLAQYLQKKVTKEEMINGLERDIRSYAKRQMTWLKKNKNIHWVHTKSEATQMVKNFLKTTSL